MANAKQVYNTLISMLDNRGWHYDRHDDDLVITFGVNGDDIAMSFVIIIDEKRSLVSVYSRMPFDVPEEKRMEAAVAVCVATYGLVDGNFDYDLNKGRITFRQTASFRESEIGEGLFSYLIDWACSVVDRYNDKFLALITGVISLEDFIAQG